MAFKAAYIANFNGAGRGSDLDCETGSSLCPSFRVRQTHTLTAATTAGLLRSTGWPTGRVKVGPLGAFCAF